MKVLLQATIFLILCSCQNVKKGELSANIYKGEGDNKALHVKKGDKVSKLRLPRSNDEVKNFDVLGVDILDNIVLLMTHWGGGNYFYTDTFYFQYNNNILCLKKVNHAMYIHDKDSTVYIKKEFTPALSVDNITLADYL